MKNIIRLFPLLVSLLIISSCKTLTNKEEFIDEYKENNKESSSSENKQLEIRFSCGENGISKYTDDGWVVVKEYTEEKICTWKSVPATKDCDMEKDKGCKITKPDKIGQERIYLLER
tara:strand:+ start:79 stop:429 length:351 start_codon:yes stop_codon:yes gene_type:complete